MLKKRLAVVTVALGLAVPSLGAAQPLGWMSDGKLLLGGVARLWDFLAGAPHGTAPAAGSVQRKIGAGHDPNGGPLDPPPGGASQSTTTGAPIVITGP